MVSHMSASVLQGIGFGDETGAVSVRGEQCNIISWNGNTVVCQHEGHSEARSGLLGLERSPDRSRSWWSLRFESRVHGSTTEPMETFGTPRILSFACMTGVSDYYYPSLPYGESDPVCNGMGDWIVINMMAMGPLSTMPTVMLGVSHYLDRVYVGPHSRAWT